MFYQILVYSRLPVSGMAIFPFIFVKTEAMKYDPVLINHEKIHLRQQLELLIIPFYLLYVLNYLVNLIHFKNHDQAYFNISFEEEAYHFEHDLTYLNHRNFFSWWYFIRSSKK